MIEFIRYKNETETSKANIAGTVFCCITNFCSAQKRIVVSGATDHMTYYKDELVNAKDNANSSKEVHLPNGHSF